MGEDDELRAHLLHPPLTSALLQASSKDLISKAYFKGSAHAIFKLTCACVDAHLVPWLNKEGHHHTEP
jgi:hypothetical protein